MRVCCISPALSQTDHRAQGNGCRADADPAMPVRQTGTSVPCWPRLTSVGPFLGGRDGMNGRVFSQVGWPGDGGGAKIWQLCPNPGRGRVLGLISTK